jgi:hypothetical protein
MSMSDGEKILFDLISEIRKDINDGFKESRQDHQRAHKRIDQVEKEIAAVDKKVAINKTKLGVIGLIIVGGTKALDFFIK